MGVTVFLPQCWFDFVYDDTFIIARNPAVRGGAWVDCFTEPYWPRNLGLDPLYRPVTMLTLRLNHALFSDDPFGYRATNAALHGLCSALVAMLAMRSWRTRSAGWVAGLLFAVHPVHAEAVSMVVGRGELLAAAFGLTLLYRHQACVERPAPPSTRHHVVSAFLFLLAIGSKENAAALLPCVACLDLVARRADSGRPSLRERLNRVVAKHYLGLIVTLAIFLFARWLIFGGRTTLPPDMVKAYANPLLGTPVATHLATALALLFLSLRLLVMPVGLCPIWSVGGFDLAESFMRVDVLAGAWLGVSLVAVAVAGLWRRWQVGALMACTALSLILPCHFLPAANWLFAERWLYLPSAFVFVAIAGLTARWPRWAAAAGLAVGLAFLVSTWQYQRCWASTSVLMRAVVERHPFGYHGLIGHAGELTTGGRIAEAEPYIVRLRERFPHSPRTWYYVALLMDHAGRPREVLAAIEEFVRLSGPNPLPAALDEARLRAEARLRDPGKKVSG